MPDIERIIELDRSEAVYVNTLQKALDKFTDPHQAFAFGAGVFNTLVTDGVSREELHDTVASMICNRIVELWPMEGGS